jgi:translocation and assembly module TamB
VSRRRIVGIVLGSLVAILVLGLAGGILVLRSDWFHEKVRARIISTIETATGGRGEIGSFRFDWRQLRAEVDQLTLHGNEPAGRPPLFHAEKVAVGLKIVSALRRDIDIQYLEVTQPHIYLMVYPDGHTNVPEPKLQPKTARSPVETLLNLAVGRFQFQSGVFEVEERGQTPFDASGRNLNAKFLYEAASPLYRGDIAIDPLDVRWPGAPTLPVSVQMQVTLERNRIGVSSARWATGNSRIAFSGAVEDLVSPHGSFRYEANASVPEVARFLKLRNLERGTVRLAGNATWAGSSNYSVTGKLRSSGVDFRPDPLRFRNFRVDGDLKADAKSIDLSGIRLAGETADGSAWFPVAGTVATATLHDQDVDLRGVSLALLGGGFHGDGSIKSLSRFRVAGAVSGFQARRVVAVYNRRQQLPWDSLISGPITLEGSLRNSNDIRASANLTLAPVPSGPAVWGELNATFDARADTLDLGTSILNLPSSRAVVSGAIGRQLRVHLESRDLEDFLPALGESAASLPVKLDNGSVLFDGTVTGKPENPQIAGRLSLSRFAYSGTLFDSLQAGVQVSPQMVRVENAVLTRGKLRGEFQGAVGLRDWKEDDTSSIAANGALRNAPWSDLASLVDQTKLPAAGTVSVTGQFAGTIGNPQATGDLEVTKGSFQSEPFDRLTAHLGYTSRSLQVSSGQLTAGPKQVRFDGNFDHAPDNLRIGRLRFDAQSNTLPLGQIHVLTESHPGVEGTLQFTAKGAVDLSPAGYRLVDLEADATGRGLQLSGQRFGDTHFSAHSEGSLLRVSLDSDLVNAMLKGQGEWRLEGDYPGNAQLTFSRLNLAEVRDWLAPGKPGGPTDFRGFAEGELRIDGPLLKPQLLKAELRLPTLELSPAPTAGVPPAASLTLRNSGPIVAAIANSTVTIQSAHLVGRSTDITVGGRLMLQKKPSLDLRVNGQADLALLHEYDNELTSSGKLNLDAGVRGSLDAPQITGRLEVQNAAFTYADLPNGLANANGVILFSGDRATIQNLTGETGGGKLQLTGFAGYGGGDPVFRVHADAQGVRVRYPEGVSTVANANLNLTGTVKRSMVSGTITVLRSTFNVQSDFSSLLAKSAEPVQTPAAQPGFLEGLNFDVTIDTSPDLQLESSLAQGIAADASLRLRGTPTNPALLGRVHISQGQVLFFGTKYTIDQGSISFFNPVRIEPILAIDLETKARGIDITLSVTGPLNRLNVTPRSDPPLQFNEIVALLATGESTATDPNLVALQNVTPQPFQQSASALLGQVISSPVSGRLQRFFGISKVRIDPTLPGLTTNPQARVTVEQQVTPEVTFTYITNVANANPQVVSVEWSVSKQFSVLAQREENGGFGLDFFYKRAFK